MKRDRYDSYGREPMKQGKVIVCNIIMVLVAIASIVTLYIGSFMKITLTLTVNKEAAQKIAGESVDMSSIADFEVSIPISLDLKSKDLIKAGTGKSTEAAHDLVQREIGSIIDTMMKKVDEILESVTDLLVDTVVNKAEEEISKQLEEATDAEIGKELEETYGVSREDIDDLKQDVGDAVKALLNGEADQVSDILDKSETLDKLVAVYAESELKESGSGEVTQEQIEAKQIELKQEIINKYEETIDKFEAENGKISKETIIVGLVNSAEMKDENGDTVKVESVDDVKKVLADKVNEKVDENSEMIGYVLMGMGIFTLVVMASWAYLIVKIIVKTFMRNKTVGMFFPRFFGWMPHVFFVGLPMLLVKFGDKAVDAAAKYVGEGAQETIKAVMDAVSLNVTSLTWVSALGTVILLVIWFPYYSWRRQLKREAKGR